MESYHQKTIYSSMPDVCFFCHQRGHSIRNCQERRNRRGGAPQNTDSPSKSWRYGTSHPAEQTATARPNEDSPTPQTTPRRGQAELNDQGSSMDLDNDPAKLKRQRDEPEKMGNPPGDSQSVIPKLGVATEIRLSYHKESETEASNETFSSPEEEWVQVAEQLIRYVNNKGIMGRERSSWSIQEILLLECPKRIPGVPTTSGLLSVWNKAHHKLYLDQDHARNKGTTVSKFVALAASPKWTTEEEKRLLLRACTRLKLGSTGEWKEWASGHTSAHPEPRDIDLLRRMGESLLPAQGINPLIQYWEWYWITGRSRYTGWSLSTRVWKSLTKTPRSQSTALNKKWEREDSTMSWLTQLERFELCWEQRNLAELILLIKTCWIIWFDRNVTTYNNQQRSAHFKVAGKLATVTIEALLETAKEGYKMKLDLVEAQTVLTGLFPSDQNTSSELHLEARVSPENWRVESGPLIRRQDRQDSGIPAEHSSQNSQEERLEVGSISVSTL
ncbi:hypothetical protein R1sor_021130 [Riccia sorocarpa]|uniref:CCHC-type domain-containing protein n=1 Tax=Riccia sorocarpa TaxID=122646 RepID=A0ABD3GKD6_9MARC